MTELSPAAFAVVDAFVCAHARKSGPSSNADIAAALRAAAQETGKRKTLKVLGATMAQGPAYCLVSDLLAIANELEAQ